MAKQNKINQGEKKRTRIAQIDTENQGWEYLRSTSRQGFHILKKQVQKKEHTCIYIHKNNRRERDAFLPEEGSELGDKERNRSLFLSLSLSSVSQQTMAGLRNKYFSYVHKYKKLSCENSHSVIQSLFLPTRPSSS